MSSSSERALIVSEMAGLPMGFTATPTEALAGYSISEMTFTEIQETIESIENRPEQQAEGYVDLAWGLFVSGKNPDPFIQHAYQSTSAYVEDNSPGNKSLLNSERRVAIKLDTKIAELAAKRELPLASDAIERAIQNIEAYECKMEGVGGKDLLSQERFDTNESRHYILRYSLVVAPALIGLASILKENPECSERDALEIARQAEDLLFDPRSSRSWLSSSLAEAAELMLGFYMSTGDVDSVGRVYKKVLDQVRDEMSSGTSNFDRDLIKVKTMVSAFNAQIAETVNFKNLSDKDVEEVLASGDSAAHRALGKILTPNVSSGILGREDVSNEVKRSIIDGLEEKLASDEASIRTTRLLLDSRRKDFVDE